MNLLEERRLQKNLLRKKKRRMTMEAWISYNEDGKKVEGFFELLEQTCNFVKLRTGRNILIIPYHQINKIKMKDDNNYKGGSNKQ